MPLPNPMNALVVPTLVLFTLPLAVLAGITTMLAFSVLIFRVVVVYLDLALSLVPSYLLGRRPAISYRLYDSKMPSSSSSSPGSVAAGGASPPLTPGLTTTTTTTTQRRRRRLSSASAVSAAGSATPVSDGGALGLTPSVGMVRDFEGIGGWRLTEDEDELWTSINSRLELPERHHVATGVAAAPGGAARHHHYNHHRSLSGGAGFETGVLMMKGGRSRSPERKVVVGGVSPNSSRIRTPTSGPLALTAIEGDEGYFPPVVSPRVSRRISPPRT